MSILCLDRFPIRSYNLLMFQEIFLVQWPKLLLDAIHSRAGVFDQMTARARGEA